MPADVVDFRHSITVTCRDDDPLLGPEHRSLGHIAAPRQLIVTGDRVANSNSVKPGGEAPFRALQIISAENTEVRAGWRPTGGMREQNRSSRNIGVGGLGSRSMRPRSAADGSRHAVEGLG